MPSAQSTYLLVAARQTVTEHTPFNHYALLADAWLHGRQDLANGPPGYAQGNDFAQFDGKTYITFPPFPALLMLPLVALSGSAENFRDGQFILELAGLAPAFLFLVLEKLRRPSRGGEVRSDRSEKFNAGLALLFAFGTVYFFTAEQGTVWFSAHVVGCAVFALYVLFALDAEKPFLAGLCLACAFATRPTMLLAGALFALEAVRVHVAAKRAPERRNVEVSPPEDVGAARTRARTSVIAEDLPRSLLWSFSRSSRG